MDSDLEKQASIALSGQWKLWDSNLEISPAKIHFLLTNKLLEWLDNDFERLINALYQLDISEKKFHDAMSLQDPVKIAPRLADLIWEREIQKAWYRQKYS